MRSLLLAITFLAAVAVVACHWPTAAPAKPPESLRWVRTVDGWERSESLLPAERHSPGLHPFTLAALQLLGAGVALVWADWKKNGRRDAYDTAQPKLKPHRRQDGVGVRRIWKRRLHRSDA